MTCERGKWVSYPISLPALKTQTSAPTPLLLLPPPHHLSSFLQTPPFLPLNPCFLNRSLSRRKPHNNPLSRLLWGLIFLLKNAIKTHNLATKTRKNSAKTLKNTLFPLENASERLWRSFLIPENTLFGPSPEVDPSILRPDPVNNEHHRAITGRSDRLLAVFLPIYIVELVLSVLQE